MNSLLQLAASALEPFSTMATTLGDDWHESEVVTLTIGGESTTTTVRSLRVARTVHGILADLAAAPPAKP